MFATNPIRTIKPLTNSHPTVNFTSLVHAAILPCIVFAGLAAGAQVEPARLEKLATCQVSWMDCKDNDLRMSQYLGSFEKGYTQSDEEPAFLPKNATSAFGFRVTTVYPQSEGMGIGLSMLPAAPL